MMVMEEKQEGASEWLGRERERERERIGDKLTFLGNEDGHHGNCSQESHDAEEQERARKRGERVLEGAVCQETTGEERR